MSELSFVLLLGLITELGAWGVVIIIAAILILFRCVSTDNGILGLVVILITLVILSLPWFGHLDIFHTIIQNPLSVLKFTVGYFAVGVLWSMFKWKRLLAFKKREMKQVIQTFIDDLLPQVQKQYDADKRTNIIDLQQGKIPEVYKKDFRKKYGYRMQVPSWTTEKDRITSWITLWPWSVLWYILSDFLRELGHRIAKAFRYFYEVMARNAFKDIDTDLLSSSKEENDD